MRILLFAICCLLCSLSSKADIYRFTAYGNISSVSSSNSTEFLINDPIEFSFEVDDTQHPVINDGYYGSSWFIMLKNITFNLGDTALGDYNNQNGVIEEGANYMWNSNYYTPEFNYNNAIHSGFPKYNDSSLSKVILEFEPFNSGQIDIPKTGPVWTFPFPLPDRYADLYVTQQQYLEAIDIIRSSNLSDKLIGDTSMSDLFVPKKFRVEWNGEYIYGDINTSSLIVENLSEQTDTSNFESSPFGTGISIQKNSDSVSLSWNTKSNKYYSVFHSENLNGTFIPVENKYKLKNLDNFNYDLNGGSGFFKIVESDLGTVLGDFWNALNYGDSENMIPGTRARVYRSYVSDYATIDAVYHDIIFINDSEAFIIWNDGDFEIGNYSVTNIDNLSGTFNFFNRKAFYKPNARTEYPEDSSDTLVFEDSSPLNISRSYPDPDPEFTDEWIINENISFNYPSTLMANNLINKTYKVYAFSENTDYASYVELNFDTNDTGTILLAYGGTDISYDFEKLTHSVARLSFSFLPQIQSLSSYEPSSLNVDVTFFSYDAYSGYFYGTIESEGSTNEIYGYYGEEAIPVDHLYGYPLSQIFILNDQNSDGLVTQEDAEIFMANNPGMLWLYPSLGSLPSTSDIFPVVPEE